jgi:hypothetical protein
MKKIFRSIVLILLVSLPTYAQKDENNRIENSGKVIVEILNVYSGPRNLDHPIS